MLLLLCGLDMYVLRNRRFRQSRVKLHWQLYMEVKRSRSVQSPFNECKADKECDDASKPRVRAE